MLLIAYNFIFITKHFFLSVYRKFFAENFYEYTKINVKKKSSVNGIRRSPVYIVQVFQTFKTYRTTSLYFFSFFHYFIWNSSKIMPAEMYLYFNLLLFSNAKHLFISIGRFYTNFQEFCSLFLFLSLFSMQSIYLKTSFFLVGVLQGKVKHQYIRQWIPFSHKDHRKKYELDRNFLDLRSTFDSGIFFLEEITNLIRVVSLNFKMRWLAFVLYLVQMNIYRAIMHH